MAKHTKLSLVSKKIIIKGFVRKSLFLINVHLGFQVGTVHVFGDTYNFMFIPGLHRKILGG